MKTASVSANRKQGPFLLSVGLLFLLIIIPVGLTIVDLSNPEKSYRLALLSRLGLRSKMITETFSPKVLSLPSWEPSDFYWYPKDQETLNTKAGFRCAVIGDLIERSSGQWKIRSKSGQVYEVNTNDYTNIFFLVRNPFYDEKADQWAEGNRIARMEDFVEGDVVLVEWDCPTGNPREMLTNGGPLMKEEFLMIKDPLSVSKRMRKTE